MQKILGFNFIEILITLSLIGILMTFAMPIYTQHFVQANRLEAATILTQLSIALEKYFVEKNTYANATLAVLNFPELIVKKNYRLMIRTANTHEYLIIAKPLGKQFKNDQNCGSLILHSNGEKKISGPGLISECW